METVDGARVYSMIDGERALVRAFMMESTKPPA
jgi:hypothetical protein